MSTGNIIVGGNICNVPHFAIHWNIQPNLERSYAEWFADYENRTIAIIYSPNHSYALMRTGDLKVEILDRNGMLVDTIYGANGLHAWGVTSDEELENLFGMSNQSRWIEHPWIGIYDMRNDRIEIECGDIFNAMQYVIDKITKVGA